MSKKHNDVSVVGHAGFRYYGESRRIAGGRRCYRGCRTGASPRSHVDAVSVVLKVQDVKWADASAILWVFVSMNLSLL
jgi:hypothetical protein